MVQAVDVFVPSGELQLPIQDNFSGSLLAQAERGGRVMRFEKPLHFC